MGQPIRESSKDLYQFSGHLEQSARANEHVLDANLKDSQAIRRAMLWRSGMDRELLAFCRDMARLQGNEPTTDWLKSVQSSARFACWHVNYLVTHSVINELDSRAAKLPTLSALEKPLNEQSFSTVDTFITYHPKLEKIAQSASWLAHPDTEPLRRDCRTAAGYMLKISEIQIGDIVEAELALHEAEIESYGEALLYME